MHAHTAFVLCEAEYHACSKGKLRLISQPISFFVLFCLFFMNFRCQNAQYDKLLQTSGDPKDFEISPFFPLYSPPLL